MAHVTDQVYRAARAVRALGIVVLAFAVMLFIFGTSWSDRGTNSTALVLLTVTVAGVYAGVGSLFFWFAAAMIAGRRWGAVLALCGCGGVVAFAGLSLFVLRGGCGLCFVLMVTFPAAYAAFLAWPAIGDLRSRAVPPPAPRGFEVVGPWVPSTPPVPARPAPNVTPPPTVRLATGPRRPPPTTGPPPPPNAG